MTKHSCDDNCRQSALRMSYYSCVRTTTIVVKALLVLWQNFLLLVSIFLSDVKVIEAKKSITLYQPPGQILILLGQQRTC